jgi:predicted MFS family arabinose efflux permease
MSAVMAPRCIPESRSDSEARGFDLGGAFTSTAGLALLTYAIVDAVNTGWGSTATRLKIAGALVLLVMFVICELTSRSPLIPLSLFRRRTLRGSNIVGLLIGMSLYSMFFFISLYMQQVLHFSPLKAGLSYLPLSFAIILSAAAAAQLATHVGFTPSLIGGLLMVGGALLWLSRVPAVGGNFTSDLLGPSILAGVGLGFSFTPVTIGAMTGTKPHEAGVASGLINTATNMGGALGLAILATLANTRTNSLLHAGAASLADALTKGFQRAFIVGAGFAFTGAVLAAVLIATRDSRQQATAARQGEAEVAAGGYNPCTQSGTARARESVATSLP